MIVSRPETDIHGTTRWSNMVGLLHRENGPAIERANGDKYWYINGKQHREDGPAIEYNDGGKEWCIDGRPHREDGPAIEYADGRKWWFINGEELTEEEFNHHRLKKNLLELL